VRGKLCANEGEMDASGTSSKQHPVPSVRVQICSAFVDTPDCERHIEQMICAVTCFPGAH